MCCLHRRKGSHSNELCGSLRAATRMRSGWSLGSKRKFGREVLPIIGFGIVQILKSTGDTFTIIPWHTGSWIGRWNIATARRTQGSSWTACPQRLKPQLRKARIGTSGTRALSVLTAAAPLPEAGPAFPSYLKSWRVNFMRNAGGRALRSPTQPTEGCFHANGACGRITALSLRIKASKAVSLCPHHHRQLNEARLIRQVVDTLRSFAVIPGFCPENVAHKRLRIAIIQGEPTRLNLYHDAVSGEKNVVRRGQVETVEQRLVGSQRFSRLQALTIAAAKDVSGNH